MVVSLQDPLAFRMLGLLIAVLILACYLEWWKDRNRP